MRSWKLVGVWVVVLLVTTSLAWQIVSLANNQVGDAPVAIAPATTSAQDTSTTSSSTISTTTSSTTTTNDGSSSPATSEPGGSSSSTTSATASPAAEWSLRTITTEGGIVVVRYRPNEVELQAATPAPGYEMEIDDSGPPRVRVEFEDADNDIRVEARWEDGSLDVDVTGDS